MSSRMYSLPVVAVVQNVRNVLHISEDPGDPFKSLLQRSQHLSRIGRPRYSWEAASVHRCRDRAGIHGKHGWVWDILALVVLNFGSIASELYIIGRSRMNSPEFESWRIADFALVSGVRFV